LTSRFVNETCDILYKTNWCKTLYINDNE
jgi:hypothetical protein